ncbi:DNA polymerase IV [Vampirovibrio chlorellavorus]|uniref:DNA polymerase IV n=1 Tax=Vampirovibrio chlorellavorus TaxID=758823 RepID=UPI0026F1E7F4|nr:DNA polymerase IV [Vampirovibrio chlorellavorus]
MTPPCRKIIHIDMDAFYAAVEQRDFPQYRGLPLAVGGTTAQRGVIATASYEARAFGVKSAMSTYKALRLCPHLIVVPGRFEAYKEVSRQIRAIFADYTHLIEPLSLDEAYLDVTGQGEGSPSATLIAYEIKQRVLRETGLTASAGVSYNKFLAKVASDYNKPNGLCVIPPHKAQRFIEELPIGRFYGIGQKTEPRLKAMNIHTGAHLKAQSMKTLESIFGKSAAFYYHLARGRDDRPVETDWVRKSIGSETTFSQNLCDPAPMLTALSTLAAEVLAWMRRHETYGRTLTLKVKYADFQQITRSRTQATPFDTLESMMQTLAELLAQTEAQNHRPVRLLGVSVSKLWHPGETDSPVAHQSEQLKLALGA